MDSAGIGAVIQPYHDKIQIFATGKPPTNSSSSRIELFSGKYYAACTLGGIIACGPTHSAVTPLNLVKCRTQVDSSLARSNMLGSKRILGSNGKSF